MVVPEESWVLNSREIWTGSIWYGKIEKTGTSRRPPTSLVRKLSVWLSHQPRRGIWKEERKGRRGDERKNNDFCVEGAVFTCSYSSYGVVQWATGDGKTQLNYRGRQESPRVIHYQKECRHLSGKHGKIQPHLQKWSI